MFVRSMKGLELLDAEVALQGAGDELCQVRLHAWGCPSELVSERVEAPIECVCLDDVVEELVET